jgi:hypothetical protein
MPDSRRRRIPRFAEFLERLLRGQRPAVEDAPIQQLMGLDEKAEIERNAQGLESDPAGRAAEESLADQARGAADLELGRADEYTATDNLAPASAAYGEVDRQDGIAAHHDAAPAGDRAEAAALRSTSVTRGAGPAPTAAEAAAQRPHTAADRTQRRGRRR